MAILEFIQVLAAIILGLGMAELLRGFADFLRPNARAGSPMLLTFAAWLFLMHLQVWWLGWRFIDVEAWKFNELLLYITGPTMLFILARLTFPGATETQDLDSYYAEVSTRLWYLVSILFGYGIVFNSVLLNAPLLSSGPISMAILAAIGLLCANTKNQYVHALGIAGLFSQSMWRGLSDVVAG